MAITLTYLGTTATLSDRLAWTDEFSWAPVVQSVEYTTTGALLIEEAVKQAGRPITLEGNETNAWISRSLCATLQAWAALPGITLELVIRGVARAVVFDRERGGFEATPLWQLLDGEQYADENYVPTFRFLEV